MLRRSSVISVLAVIAFAMWIRLPVLAQTPITERGASTPGAYIEDPSMPGLIESGKRTFNASGTRPVGPLSIYVATLRFDTDAHAADAFQTLVDFELMLYQRGTTPFDQASAPPIGDDQMAYVGQILAVDHPGTFYPFGMFFWREGNFLYYAAGAGLDGDQLLDLYAIAEKITGRESTRATAAESPKTDGEMRSGGVWDMLPTLNDAPVGFVFKGEEIPFESQAPNTSATPDSDMSHVKSPATAAP